MATGIVDSSEALLALLGSAPDLRNGEKLDEILEVLAERRRMDLSRLTAPEQAPLIASRAQDLLPSVEAFAARIQAARTTERGFVVKFGIDPTGADVHLGHAVPMIVASRLQRMGHHVVFIVGDITALIGDPSGQTADRPRLTIDDIRRNLATYREQVSPFFDFSRAEFRFNSEWLGRITLPELLGVLEKLPVSASLQRDDFRKRMAEGASLTMAELLYSVVMALDSVELACDLELGGVDQLLNMQMCRRVMEDAGQEPEIVLTTPLIEGTDGTGAKMSKSKGNYVALASDPADMFGKLMSIPDRLVAPYFRALTEVLDPEIAEMEGLMAAGKLHPMGVKMLLASEVVATIHGAAAAAEARAAFRRQFSDRRYSEVGDLPSVAIPKVVDSSLADILATMAGLLPSKGQVRRVAQQGGLRLVRELPSGEQETVGLTEANAVAPLADLMADHQGWFASAGENRLFLKCGRVLLALDPAS
jgi:tyrosyl-tRNA synthetase